MPQVRVSIQSFQHSITVIFMDTSSRPRQIGRIRRYADDSPIFEMLRRAHASLETVNIVENAMRENRCCMVVLDLTHEQLAKLEGR